jgi:hypothetical protein
MATAREEAERLVAAALAAASFASRARGKTAANRDDRSDDRGPSLDDLAGLASLAARFLGGRPAEPPPAPAAATGHHIATGSPECCICPICRAIAAVRDPSPEFAERLAAGASDLAAGVTSILRALGEATRRGDTHSAVDVTAVPPAETGWPSDVDDELEFATESETEDESPWPALSDFGSVWQAATRAQDQPRKSAGSGTTTSSPARTAGTGASAPAKKSIAKKAVAKKTAAAAPSEASGTATKKAAPKRVAPKKAAPKKAAAAKRAPAADSGTTGAKSAAPTSGSAKKAAAKKTPAKKAKP